MNTPFWIGFIIGSWLVIGFVLATVLNIILLKLGDNGLNKGWFITSSIVWPFTLIIIAISGVEYINYKYSLSEINYFKFVDMYLSYLNKKFYKELSEEEKKRYL